MFNKKVLSEVSSRWESFPYQIILTLTARCTTLFAMGCKYSKSKATFECQI